MPSYRITISLVVMAFAVSSCSQAGSSPDQPASEFELATVNDPLDQPLPNPETDFAKIEQIAEDLESTGAPKGERALFSRWMLNATQILIAKRLSPDTYANTGKWPATVREAIEQQRENEAAEARRIQINRLRTWCEMYQNSDAGGPLYPDGPFEMDGKSFDDPCSALSTNGIPLMTAEDARAAEQARIINERLERERREAEAQVERDMERLRAAMEENATRQEEDIRLLDALD